MCRMYVYICELFCNSKSYNMTNFAALYDLQVCLDYWNSLVLELFEPHHNLDTPAATVNMMGLQVECIYYEMVVVKWINVVVS